MFSWQSPSLMNLRSSAWKVILLALSLLAFSVAVQAEDEFLEPELAFKFSARMVDAKNAEVTYAIADGYYMYREHFKFRVEGAKLGVPVYPKGIVKFDETFQKNVETYHHAVSVRLPVDAKGAFTLISTGQGCAEKGLCYPPQESRITLTPPAGASSKSTSDVQAPPPSQGSGGEANQTAGPTPNLTPPATVPETPNVSAAVAPAYAPSVPDSAATFQTDADPGVLEKALNSRNLLVILPLFLLIGLGLSLTPCVFPMLPILTSIIVGEGAAVTRKRGLTLASTYSLGMALVYTGLGVLTGLLGEGLAASFQNPWVLRGFGLLIGILALSMFDVYQLQMPAAIQVKLIKISDKQAAGKLAGVFVMGALSGLIIGPCVTAPLIAVLLLISKTHDAVFGGSILFTLAVGMSTPLLLIGVSAGWLLPKAGMWMDSIKRFFGVLLLGVALWLASPAIPASLHMPLWAILTWGYAAYLLFGKQLGRVSNAFGVVFALFGTFAVVATMQSYGWIAGGSGQSLSSTGQLAGQPETQTQFIRVKSVAELDALLAKDPGKTAMLDFYADWCVSCKEMEKLTFSDAQVKKRFANMVLLQADVTANNDDDKALLKRFNLFGPPGIIFFKNGGKEISGGRVVGYQKAEKFTASLDSVLHPST